MFYHKKGFLRAFTFVEMALVVSLLSLVSLAVYRSLSNGLEIWKRSARFILEEDAAIFLEGLTRELSNTLSYSLLPFEGEADRVRFATMIRTASDKQGSSARQGYVSQIGCVEYSFDRGRSALVRRQANYGQALDGEFQPGRVRVRPVDSFQLLYYSRDGSVLKSTDGMTPFTVEVKMTFHESSGAIRTLRRLIPVPVGA